MGVGMKVVVFDDLENVDEPIGIGELTRYEDVTVTDENDKVLCKVKTPIIIMEDGGIIAGFECWWINYADFVTINHMMLYEQGV